MGDLESRLAALESASAVQVVKQEYTEDAFVRMEKSLELLNENLSTINSSMSRYRGMGAMALLAATFIGGITSLIVSLWLKG